MGSGAGIEFSFASAPEVHAVNLFHCSFCGPGFLCFFNRLVLILHYSLIAEATNIVNSGYKDKAGLGLIKIARTVRKKISIFTRKSDSGKDKAGVSYLAKWSGLGP